MPATFRFQRKTVCAVRLLVTAVLALSPVALAQADDPGTWLRVLELPVFSGPVAGVHVTITDVTDPQSPRLHGFERWELNANNLPVRASTYYEPNHRLQDSAETEWTWTDQLLPQSMWRITAHGIARAQFVRVSTNVFEEQVTNGPSRVVRRHEVFPADRQVVTTSFEFNAPFRRTSTFGPDWLTVRRVSEGDLGDSESYWHALSAAEFDSAGVLRQFSSDAGDEVWTVSQRDGFGNPREASYVYSGPAGTFTYRVSWRYTYRDADSGSP